jgi:hypothetical protein
MLQIKIVFRKYFLPYIVYYLFKGLSSSWRKKIHEEVSIKDLQKDSTLIFAHWHGDELCLMPLVSKFKLATMTSLSKDGQLVEFVIQKLGGVSSKGSSSRGAVSALKGLIRLMRKGHPVSMAVDGPRGPIYKPKPGVFELAKLSKSIIIPVSSASSRSIFFHKSWNKTYLPKPFAKVIYYFGKPLSIDFLKEDPRNEKLANILTQSIDECKRNACDLIDSP